MFYKSIGSLQCLVLLIGARVLAQPHVPAKARSRTSLAEFVGRSGWSSCKTASCEVTT
jgi:hypothetical protein